MQQATNVSLSAFELKLVCNAGWILTKNGIIEKVYHLFGLLATAYRPLLQATSLPVEVKATDPKIARGEKYEGLPWVMLDYPRHFTREHSFAIRTFFWWGHFFSITLHLSGTYLRQYRFSLEHAYEAGKLHNAWVSCGQCEWEHHFRSTNMELIGPENWARALEQPFLKLAYKTELQNWTSAETYLLRQFERILEILGH